MEHPWSRGWVFAARRRNCNASRRLRVGRRGGVHDGYRGKASVADWCCKWTKALEWGAAECVGVAGGRAKERCPYNGERGPGARVRGCGESFAAGCAVANAGQAQR